MSDSVAIFREGSFEEQIKELVEYIAKPLVDEERTAFIRPFSEALRAADGAPPFAESKERRRRVISLVVAEVKSFGEGSEREIEGFFNQLFAHVLDVFPQDALDAPVKHIQQVVVSSTPPPDSAIKFRILTNLFNALPRRSHLRLPVAESLVALADGDLDVLQLSPLQVGKWLSEWDVSLDAKSAFLKIVAEATAKAGQQDVSYSYLLDRLRLIPTASPDAEAVALDTISAALHIPSIYDFDALAKVDAVQSAKDHPLFGLLKIFMLDGVKEYLAWAEQHASVLEQHSLDSAVLERKIRLLTLATLAARNVGRDLSYAEIASGLQIDATQVEVWVIDVIRAGLLSGKLSQPTQTLRVTRSTSRSFSRTEWETLEQRLATWKAGLLGVLEVVAAARSAAGRDILHSTTSPVAQTA